MEMRLSGIKPDIRFLNALRPVLYDKKWAKTAPNLELYYMYRGVKEKEDLRYDITVIPPKMLGKEFVKTKGHKHNAELYIVLEGKAIFLLQKREGEKIKDVYATKAKKKDLCVIPQDYEHITINPGRKTLKLSNWIAKKPESNYKTIKEKQGLCYYYLKSGWLKNKNYKHIPKLRFEKPLKEMPKSLGFLKPL